jgi:predicted nucleic acid-binding protein
LTLFVDTTVWSLYFRRDVTPQSPEIIALRQTLSQGAAVATGFVLQELLQGILGPRAKTTILEHFNAIHMITPSRDDHVEAAELRNHCRRTGIQVGTVDALIAQLCIARDLELLTIDNDFKHVSRKSRLRVWHP